MFERQLSGTTVRAAAYLAQLPTKEQVMSRLEDLVTTYPFLNERYSDGKFYSDSKPIISEVSFDNCGNMEESDFMSHVLSNLFSENDCEVFLVTRPSSEPGSIMISCRHSFCDGGLIGQLLADILSGKQINAVERILQTKVIKNLSGECQPIEDLKPNPEFPLLVLPPSQSESNDPLKYSAVCLQYDVGLIKNVCHSLKVRPQSLFSVAEIFSIAGALKQTKPFTIINQVSVNTRRYLKLDPRVATCYASPTYVKSEISNETTCKSLMMHIQQSIDNTVEKYCIGNLSCFINGSLIPVKCQSMISNVGIVSSDIPIWIQGGMNNIPESYRKLRSFTAHGATSHGANGDKGCLVMTFLVPSCEPEFINNMRNSLKWFLEHPNEALERKII